MGIPVPFHVPAPSPCKVESPLLHLEFDVARETVEGEELNELYLRVSSQDLSRPSLVEEAVHLVREIVEPIVDEWKLLPGQGNDLRCENLGVHSPVQIRLHAHARGTCTGRHVSPAQYDSDYERTRIRFCIREAR